MLSKKSILQKKTLAFIFILILQFLAPINSSIAGSPHLVLAYQGPLTGPAGALGAAQYIGVRFAISQFNAKNPNTQIELTTIDDQGDPAQAPALASYVVSQTDTIGVIGPAFSGAALVSLPYYRKANLPLISPSATNPNLANPDRVASGTFHRVVPPYIGGNSLNSDSIGTALANLSLTLLKGKSRKNKIEVIFSNDGYFSSPVSNDVIRALEKNKANFSTYTLSNTDYASASSQIIADAPKIVAYIGSEYLGYPANEAGKFLKALRGRGFSGEFITLDLDVGYGEWKPAFISEAGSVASNTIIISGCFDLKALNQKVAKEFEASQGVPPSCLSTDAINATNIFLEGITKGAVTRGDLASFVNSYSGYGLAGNPISFTPEGDLVKPIWALEKFNGSDWKYFGSSNTRTQAGLIPSISGYRKTKIGFNFRITNFSLLYSWSASTTSVGEMSIDNKGIVTFVTQGRITNSRPTVTVTSNRAGYLMGETSATLR